MTDLNTMMREQAVNGLQLQLDAAVTDGDTVKARKISDDLAALKMSTAPKPPAFTPDDIRTEMEKLPWYGTDPKKSGRAVELGKNMDPKKFASAAAFAEALVKVVDEEFKPAPKDGEEDEPKDGEEDEPNDKSVGRARKTDGPGEGDATQRTVRRSSSGPWAKISDAPADVQKEIKRQTDKFVSANASKEQRESFVTKALESHYAAHQRKAGKK